MESECPSEPDSTTAEREFCINDDVLCRIEANSDQLYLGVIVQVEAVLRKLLVRFLDGSETWCHWEEVKLFGSSPSNLSSTTANHLAQCTQRAVLQHEEAPTASEEDWATVCLVCHSKRQPLAVCICGRAYHHNCHSPRIPRDGDAGWRCKECLANVETNSSNGSDEAPPLIPVSVLPSLLQCRRCQRRLRPPNLPTLLPGDRFYKFVCAACSGSAATFHRPPLRWQDIVHIALYNLTLERQTKYHELDQAIVPWLDRHWSKLHATHECRNKEELRASVLDTLRTVHGKFKCGRETKKRVTLWGLRRRGGRVGMGAINNNTASASGAAIDMPVQNHLVNSSKKDDPEDCPLSSRMQLLLPSANDNPVCSTTPIQNSNRTPPGSGLVVRSMPFPTAASPASHAKQNGASSSTVVASPNTHAARKALRRATRRLLLNAKRGSGRDTKEEGSDDEREDGEKVVRRRPQRNLLEARLNSTESKLYNPQVSPPEVESKKRPADSPSKKKSLKEEPPHHKRRLVQKTLHESFAATQSSTPATTPNPSVQNSSDDDDKNFHPKKFILKTRRLREQDIIVDANGVVRRRRRQRNKIFVAPPPNQHQLLPEGTGGQQQQQTEAVTQSTVHTEAASPPPLDLRVWARECFGVVARVEEGEKFTLLARRTLNDGRVEGIVQFLGRDQDVPMS